MLKFYFGSNRKSQQFSICLPTYLDIGAGKLPILHICFVCSQIHLEFTDVFLNYIGNDEVNAFIARYNLKSSTVQNWIK